MNPLLQAIIDDPNDINARLVYTDWCDEDGQYERAEFIRMQCERKKAGGNNTPYFWKILDEVNEANTTECICLRCTLRRRELKLLAEYHQKLADLPPLP